MGFVLVLALTFTCSVNLVKSVPISEPQFLDLFMGLQGCGGDSKRLVQWVALRRAQWVANTTTVGTAGPGWVREPYPVLPAHSEHQGTQQIPWGHLWAGSRGLHLYH